MHQLNLHLPRFRLDATTAVGAVFLAFGLGIVVGGYLTSIPDNEKSGLTFIRETYSNFGIELVSIAVTVIVIDRLNRRRDEQGKVNEEKAQLLRDVRSNLPDTVTSALHEMRERGWLEGDSGLLKNADLGGANLSGAILGGANLSGAFLWRTNLSGVELGNANLSGAKLGNANLSGAKLRRANLSGAKLAGANLGGAELRGANLNGATLVEVDLSGAELRGANLNGAELGHADLRGANLNGAGLSGTDLRGANLSGAKLAGANLSGADLWDTTFDEATTLPDRTRWTPDTDMARFTDPQHPDFWRSDDEDSSVWR